jgi:hypothetical protein
MNTDCYLNIISFLDIKDNNNIGLVNKPLYMISKNDLIWKSFFCDNFYNIECTKMFHFNYIKCCKFSRFLIDNCEYFLGKDINKIDDILQLDSKQLQIVPSEIGILTKLQRLNLANNQLHMIPIEIWHLDKLQELCLYNNQLVSMPPEIGRLGMLIELDLSYNKLDTIPSEIGLLSKLHIIDLDYNKLHTIPSEIWQLPNLQKIFLDIKQSQLVPQNINRNIIRIC